MKPATLPVQGKAIRFAPGRNQEPAATFWRIWVEGSEIYAMTRNSMGVTKISVHASGQIHYRLGPKVKQDLAPLMQLGAGPWFHAVEIRFLLSEGAKSPTKQRESLKNKKAYLIPAPEGQILHANLIIGRPGMPLNTPLPEQFGGAQALWQAVLSDGRLAVLVVRVLALDDVNREKIKFYREELKPTVSVRGNSKDSYVELVHFFWSPEGGNVALVIPMGDEAVRNEDEDRVTDEEPRIFHYESPGATADVIAPDGKRVAILELEKVDKQIALVKNEPSSHELGEIKLQLDPSNLITGSKFMASPCKLVCVPSLSGANPRNWEYLILARFDGFALSADLRPISIGLRNKNFASRLPQLDDREEIVMVIPPEVAALRATLDAPTTSVKVLGRFTLRDGR
jgi:hypothetical protein